MKKLLFACVITSSVMVFSQTAPKIEHNIKNAKQAILLELRDTLIIRRKAKFAAKNALGGAYIALKAAVENVIDYITHSEEFLTAIDKVTNYQVHCICDEGITFKDISYEYDEPLMRKIDLELEIAFPDIDEQTATFFNIFYATLVNSHGCRMLLDKLTKVEKRLKKLQSSNNNIIS